MDYTTLIWILVMGFCGIMSFIDLKVISKHEENQIKKNEENQIKKNKENHIKYLEEKDKENEEKYEFSNERNNNIIEEIDYDNIIINDYIIYMSDMSDMYGRFYITYTNKTNKTIDIIEFELNILNGFKNTIYTQNLTFYDNCEKDNKICLRKYIRINNEIINNVNLYKNFISGGTLYEFDKRNISVKLVNISFK